VSLFTFETWSFAGKRRNPPQTDSGRSEEEECRNREKRGTELLRNNAPGAKRIERGRPRGLASLYSEPSSGLSPTSRQRREMHPKKKRTKKKKVFTKRRGGESGDTVATTSKEARRSRISATDARKNTGKMQREGNSTELTRKR